MAKSKTSGGKISFIILILTIISRLLILYQKYRLTSLSVSDFHWINIGNLINAFLIIIFIVGFFFNKNHCGRFESLLLVISIMNLFIIVIPLKLEFISTKLSNAYIFNSTAEKIFIAALKLIVEFSFVYQISIIFLSKYLKTKFLFIKAFLITGNYFIVLLMFTYLFILKSPFNSENEIQAGNNLGVVLGAAVWSDNNPSPLFQSRITKSFLLLREGKINKILLTGGMAPGEISEAKSASDLLSKLGVSKSKMILEEKTSTTLEQIEFLVHKKELSDYDNFILISDSFHLARVSEMSKLFNLQVTLIPSGHELNWKKLLYFRIRETFALLLFWLFGI